jgi:adenylate kinase family enzyme
MRRVAGVGAAGCGKTSLAAEVARRLGTPHVELDVLYRGPGWQAAEREAFRASVAGVLSGDAWVADGNYGSVRDTVWARADTLVWLDYRAPVIMARVLRRTVARVTGREEPWNGSRETLRDHLREPIFVMALQQRRKLRRTLPEWLVRPAYRHLRVVRLHSPREA